MIMTKLQDNAADNTIVVFVIILTINQSTYAIV